jgi:hypothetical protein
MILPAYTSRARLIVDIVTQYTDFLPHGKVDAVLHSVLPVLSLLCQKEALTEPR